MKICLFGATGGVGAEILRQAREAGHEVRAFVRPRSADKVPGAVVGELDDEAALRRALEGADAVVSALGPRGNRPEEVPRFADAMARITRLMAAHGPRRLVAISGAGVVLDGDAPSAPRAMIRGVLKLVARHVLACKQREAEAIRASDVDWILVRPPRIVAAPPTGRVRADATRTTGAKITRADLAAFMLGACASDEWVRRAPFVSS